MPTLVRKVEPHNDLADCVFPEQRIEVGDLRLHELQLFGQSIEQ